MKQGLVYKTFIYFLCFSFLLLTGGFSRMAADAKEGGLPIGEMISRGGVKFEARENVWKRVDPAHFPIFQGVRIRTEKGRALVVLANNIQIEAGQDCLFSFQDEDQFNLFQGRVSFRIPSNAKMSLRVANLLIGRSLPVQAAKAPLISPGNEEIVGSIGLRPNGAVTVKSIRGPLSIQSQDRVVLATLSSKEVITIPAATALGDSGEMVVQYGERPVGQYPTGKAALDEPPLGLSTFTWMLIGLTAVGVAGIGIVLAAADDDDDRTIILCP